MNEQRQATETASAAPPDSQSDRYIDWVGFGHAVGDTSLLARAVNLASAGFAVVQGPDHRFVLANPAIREAMDAPPVGRTIADVFPPPLLRHLIEGIEQIHRTGRPARLPDLPVAASGGERFWTFDLIPLGKPGPTPPAILIHAQDVTQRVLAYRQAERRTLAADAALAHALAASDASLRALFNASTESIALVEADGTIELINQPGAERLGGTSDALIGRCIWDLMPPETAAHSKIRWDEALATRKPVRFTARHAGRWCDTNFCPVIGPGGEIRTIAVFANDITGQTLAQDELRDAKQKAERANTAKTRFLAAASHDLRQPFQALVLFQNVLARRNRDPDMEPIVTRIGQAIEAQQHMLDVLLDISRLDAGIVEARKSDFPIDAILERLADEFAVQAQDRRLDLHIVGSAATVYSDPDLLERILRNLLINALKYTERGRILLGCRRAGRFLRIQVWDTGSGIPGDQISTIFEEYNQIGNPARDRSKGLGLGLAIVDRLIRLLGHRIAVRSEVGRGTVFEVIVPLAETEADEARTMIEPPLPVDRASALIAVIDDDGDLLEALRLSLELVGYRVAAAKDVEEALARLAPGRTPPGLIVADYRLESGRTGSEAIQRLRSAFGMAIPGILLTGDTSPERLREAKASGFWLLHKPVSPETLIAAIERGLLADPRRRPTPSPDLA